MILQHHHAGFIATLARHVEPSSARAAAARAIRLHRRYGERVTIAQRGREWRIGGPAGYLRLCDDQGELLPDEEHLACWLCGETINEGCYCNHDA